MTKVEIRDDLLIARIQGLDQVPKPSS